MSELVWLVGLVLGTVVVFILVLASEGKNWINAVQQGRIGILEAQYRFEQAKADRIKAETAQAEAAYRRAMDEHDGMHSSPLPNLPKPSVGSRTGKP